MIDLHTHILPGVDDGVQTVEEARELGRRAAAERVEVVAATPHVRADYPTKPDEMEQGVAALALDFERHEVPVRVIHGGELDVGLLWQLRPAELLRFTIGQTGRYVLLEVPYRGSPAALRGAVVRLRNDGITPLLAHPERNPLVQDRPVLVEPLVEVGALVQVTAASLCGGFDRASQLAAETLLSLGIVHVLASDAHGPRIARGSLAAAADTIADPAWRRFLTVDAPAAIVAGEEMPAPPAGRASLRI